MYSRFRRSCESGRTEVSGVLVIDEVIWKVVEVRERKKRNR